MTSLTSNLSPFSVRRTSDMRSFRTHGRVASPGSSVFPTAAHIGGSPADGTEDPVASFFPPGLLEHLQTPLSRYRE